MLNQSSIYYFCNLVKWGLLLEKAATFCGDCSSLVASWGGSLSVLYPANYAVLPNSFDRLLKRLLANGFLREDHTLVEALWTYIVFHLHEMYESCFFQSRMMFLVYANEELESTVGHSSSILGESLVWVPIHLVVTVYSGFLFNALFLSFSFVG